MLPECELYNSKHFDFIYSLIEANKNNECINYIENNNVNLAMGGNLIFKSSAHLGNIEIIKYLLTKKEVTPYDNENVALFHAASNGNFDLVKFFLNDPMFNFLPHKKHTVEAVYLGDYTSEKMLLVDRDNMIYLLLSNYKIKTDLFKNNKKLYFEVNKIFIAKNIMKKLIRF
jgi:ankyrin repeat protein